MAVSRVDLAGMLDRQAGSHRVKKKLTNAFNHSTISPLLHARLPAQNTHGRKEQQKRYVSPGLADNAETSPDDKLQLRISHFPRRACESGGVNVCV